MVSPWQPGQLLFVGFPAGPPSQELLDAIAKGRIGGIILFARNIEDPASLRQLIQQLQRAAPPELPLMFSIDQEGGRVQRMRDPWTEWPPMAQVAASDDLERTQKVHQCIATELGDLGITLSYTPVADVLTRSDNPVIGDRAFGETPEKVARHVQAAIRGTHAAGVATCAKHFPGHGDTDLDSHFHLPTLDHELSRLKRIELPPFAAAIEAEVASMMTAHVLFPAIDRKRPATLSPDLMALLREDLAYDGLVFSDDLEMKAVADHFSVRERTLGPLQAGVDALLICSQQDLWLESLALLEKARDSEIEQALTRMTAFKSKWVKKMGADQGLLIETKGGAAAIDPRAAASPGPPYPEHRALAEKIRNEAEKA